MCAHSERSSPLTAPEAIAVTNLTKQYGAATALDRVSFAVEHGQAVALWGPNGAGKTTILRCLLGLARHSGDVRIMGIDPTRDGRTTRRLIGFVPQDLPVTASTVSEMAAFIARLKGVPVSEADERLAMLGIGDQGDKQVRALSGGMKQRLALALALIGSPPLLLLDEPTANLDARGRAELLDLLKGLNRGGLTLVFSSHRPDDILALAHQIVLIEHGVLQRIATPAEFREEIGSAFNLVVTLKNGHMPEALTTLRGLGLEGAGTGHVLSVPVPIRRKAEVIGALVQRGVEIEDFELERTQWTERS